jgi:two-component system LytT family sensor kinase
MATRFRRTRIALGASALIAFLELFRSGLTRVLEGHPLTFFEFAHWLLPLWLGVVVLSPWCAFMARRFPPRGGHVAAFLAAHAGGATVFVGAHLAMLGAFHHVMRLIHPPTIDLTGPHQFVFYLGMESSVYAVIVMAVLLLEARHEAAERDLATARLETELANARLEGLRSQIRPHFLFNTLNTLAVLARQGEGATVDRAIGELGELLRASFSNPGAHEVPLGDELAFVEHYLALQRLRFPDRLRADVDATPETRAVLVPALVLQPLVENAIEHGLEREGGGRVTLRARRQGATLELVVEDDGPGFAPGAGAGVGLANVRERLALLHGGNAALELGRADSGGARVRIVLPWREGPAS